MLRVSRAVEKELRACDACTSGKLKLTQLQTKKDGCSYHDSALASFAEEYAVVKKQYDAEQRTLASKVIDTAATFCPVILECHTLLGASPLEASPPTAATSARLASTAGGDVHPPPAAACARG